MPGARSTPDALCAAFAPRVRLAALALWLGGCVPAAPSCSTPGRRGVVQYSMFHGDGGSPWPLEPRLALGARVRVRASTPGVGIPFGTTVPRDAGVVTVAGSMPTVVTSGSQSVAQDEFTVLAEHEGAVDLVTQGEHGGELDSIGLEVAQPVEIAVVGAVQGDGGTNEATLAEGAEVVLRPAQFWVGHVRLVDANARRVTSERATVVTVEQPIIATVADRLDTDGDGGYPVSSVDQFEMVGRFAGRTAVVFAWQDLRRTVFFRVVE